MGMELGEVGCMIQIQVQMHYSPPCNLLYDMMGSLMPLYVTATRRQWSMVNGHTMFWMYGVPGRNLCWLGTEYGVAAGVSSRVMVMGPFFGECGAICAQGSRARRRWLDLGCVNSEVVTWLDLVELYATSGDCDFLVSSRA